MKLKAKISYFIEVDIATPNYFKTVCVNVLNIAAIERAGKNTLLHLTIPNGNDGHIIYEVSESYDMVISQIEDAWELSNSWANRFIFISAKTFTVVKRHE